MSARFDQPDVLDTPAAGGMVVRGGTIRGLGFLVSTVASLGAVVLLTRYLGVARYGRYQTVVSIVAVVQILADAGLGTLGLRELSQRHGEDRRRFLRALLGLRLVLGGVTVTTVSLLLVLGGDGELAAGTALMGAGLLLTLVQSTYALPLAVGLRLGTVTALDTGRQVLFAGTLAALVLAGAGLLPLLAATIPAAAIALLWTLRLLRGVAPAVAPSLRPAELLAVVRPAVPVAVATSCGVVYLYAVQLLMAAVASPQQTGEFAIAFRIFVVAASVPAVLITAAFPLLARAARDDEERFAAALSQLLQAMLLIGGAVAVVTTIGATPLIDIAGGDGYEAATDVLRVQGLVLLVSFVLPVLGFALLALQRHRGLTIANLCGLAAVLVATPLLVAVDGARGAAWAQLAGESALLGGYVIALTRAAGRPLRVGLGATTRVLVAVSAGLLIGIGLDRVAPAVFAAALGALAYALFAARLGAVPPGLRELLSGRSHRSDV